MLRRRRSQIEAKDGALGHVDDFLVDDDGWCVRYMIVDTRNSPPRRNVLIAPQWIKALDWGERRVAVRFRR